MYYCRHSF